MVDIDLTVRAAVVGGSQPLRAILETPTTPGPWPGVVMIHEAFGLEEVMQRQAKRLAAAGFLTLAVDLYSAGGGEAVPSAHHDVDASRDTARRSPTSKSLAVGWWNPRTAPERSVSSDSAWAAASRWSAPEISTLPR